MTISPSFVAEQTSTAVNRHYAEEINRFMACSVRGGTVCDILQKKNERQYRWQCVLLQKKPHLCPACAK